MQDLPLKTATSDVDPPIGWYKAGNVLESYEVGVDNTVRHSGTGSGYICSRTYSTGFGTMMQTIKANHYRGKRLRLSGYIKTIGESGSVGLWMRVDGPDDEVLGFDNMDGRRIKGNTEWKQHHIVLDVPNQATFIAFGLLLSGQGNAWVDDVTLTTVSSRVPTTGASSEDFVDPPDQPVNLDFED